MPFLDKRNGQLIVLMQCAAGWHWIKKKPIPLPAWGHFIHWNPNTTIQSIAIAEVVELTKWQNTVDEYGIIFDRARIVRCLYADKSKLDAELRKEIIDWCKSQLN